MFEKILNIMKKFKRVTEDFELKLDLSHRSNYLLNLALTSKESIISDARYLNKELIVSLTTYNKRIHDVHLVIESIAQQSLKPNRIILWLDESEFTLDTIPLVLKRQIDRGLDIRFCPNYRSYKKLIPTLQLQLDANIITIDDDVLYPHDTLELLCNEHKLYPDCIIGHRVHKINFDKQGEVAAYDKWDYETNETNESYRIIAIGVGGVFYPANCFNEECLNVKKFMELSPFADDIWFKAMTLLNGKKHKKVSDIRGFARRFLILDSNQDIALGHSNVIEGRNDGQLASVFEEYNLKVEDV